LVAFWSPEHKKFIKMPAGPAGTSMTESSVSENGSLPEDWSEEGFRVLDAGVGLYAFFNEKHKAFFQMSTKIDKSTVRQDATDLPTDWVHEAFKIIDAGNDLNALWSPTSHKFVRMPEDATSAYLDVTEERLNASLPAAWTWAHFKIIEIEESAKPEDEVTVYSTGDFKPNVHLAKSDFDKLVLSAAAADGSVIVRRECKHCTEVWQDIYLKLNSAKYFPSSAALMSLS